MNWLIKVTFMVIYFAVNINCLPLRNYSQRSITNEKGYVPVYKYNSNYKSPTDAHRAKLRNRDLSLNVLNNRLKRIYSDLSKKDASISHHRAEMKRGLNVGIHVDDNLEKLEDILAKVLGERLTEESNNSTDCPSCDEEEEEIPVKRIVTPAYECDEWDSKHRVCILERNIGDTVTFYLSTGKHGGSLRHSNVTWKKEFHMQNSADRKEFILKPENCPENIIIGRKGYELRVSPITETDVEYNMFSASLSPYSVMNKVYFMIRVVAIDLGFVYVGETIELNLRNYVSLPIKSLSFKWYMEKDGEHGTLPSNMKVSFTGSSIKISELRQEQEGVLACSVYTNLNFLATKKRFLIKDLAKNNDVLQSSPNHTLTFQEVSERKKRYPIKSGNYPKSAIKLRHIQKRNLADEIETELLKPTTTGKQYPIASGSNDYNLEVSRTRNHDSEEPQVPVDYQSRFPEISESEDNDEDYLSKPKQIDISIDSGTAKDEKVEVELATHPQLEFAPQTEPPIDELIAPRVNQYKPADILTDNNRGETVIDTQDKITLKSPAKKLHQTMNLQTKMKTHKSNQKGDYSEVILNIDDIPKPHKITAEDRISKLISSCSNDFECSESAVCITSSLWNFGFCKCLPGSIGVGIFCREEIWLSDSKFDIEE